MLLVDSIGSLLAEFKECLIMLDVSVELYINHHEIIGMIVIYGVTKEARVDKWSQEEIMMHTVITKWVFSKSKCDFGCMENPFCKKSSFGVRNLGNSQTW